MQQGSHGVHRVLWTGGWDSTFWILRIMEESDLVVEPHYIIYDDRPSWQIELQTMDNLRNRIEQRMPQAKGRILDVKTTNADDIPHFPEHAEALEVMRQERHVGGQYAWLADYCKAHDIAPIDLCTEANTALAYAFSDRVVRTEGPLENYRLPSDNGAYSTLCQRFRFPLLLTDKPTMFNIARERGWMPIMKQTWFCHSPVAGRYACGTCRPCVYVMDRKEFFRMSTIGKIRYYALERPKRLLPQSLKDHLRASVGPAIRRFLRA